MQGAPRSSPPAACLAVLRAEGSAGRPSSAAPDLLKAAPGPALPAAGWQLRRRTLAARREARSPSGGLGEAGPRAAVSGGGGSGDSAPGQAEAAAAAEEEKEEGTAVRARAPAVARARGPSARRRRGGRGDARRGRPGPPQPWRTLTQRRWRRCWGTLASTRARG